MEKHKELYDASKDVLKWLNSDEVKSVFAFFSTRSILQCDSAFSDWSGKVLTRFENVVESIGNEAK
jgi:hypothetical protein